MIKGIAKPREYSNSKIDPFRILPVVLASIKADDKNAPTHGVHDNENIIPNAIEVINVRFLFFCLIPFVLFRKLINITPI